MGRFKTLKELQKQYGTVSPGFHTPSKLKTENLKFGDQLAVNGQRHRVISDKGDYIETQVMAPKRSHTIVRITHEEIDSVKRITKKQQKRMLSRFK